jgi:acyl transferase domain-containing protein/3-hydroxymyristoyl/3-hydroxydecanoyl-(acyl carrier protein) dehydratase
MENIAIIGIANLFPGSSTPLEFWENLMAKKNSRSKATFAQMGVDPEAYLGKKGDVDRYYCLHGGYISDFHFDAAGYRLDPGYLAGLDDLFQFSLFVARRALEDAGYWGSPALARCGVILGNLSFPTKTSNHLFLPLYHKAVEAGLKQLIGGGFDLKPFAPAREVHPDNGLIAGLPSALLAQATGLGGSHFSLDAACASSCYSVKLACDALATGKADLMLAGAVSAADPLFVNMGFSIFQAYPANQVSAPLDANSQGLFAGEGAGMMLLKRYDDALRDGDRVLALIRGGALTNDGRGEFVLSPNTKGQVLAFERAYADAGVSPADVAFVECHATGTPKGDKVELASLETFFGRTGTRPLLGSVKSNLGHLLTAAGMPGMMKAIGSLSQGTIPGTPNLTEPLSSPSGYFGAAQIPSDAVAWPDKGKPRIAGVSVFGFGGSNAHLVLQQAPQSGQAIIRTTPLRPARAREALAIVGMDAHFGSVRNLDEFAALVGSGRTVFRGLPPLRWKGMTAAALRAEAPCAGYLESFDIDFLRFKVPPNDQDTLIPQQLLMMKVADNAALDAGLRAGSNVAVLVAMGIEEELHQYRGRVNLDSQIAQSLSDQGIALTTEELSALQALAKDSVAAAAQLNQYTSFIGNIMASRISSLWDFSGPAFTISSEENSVYRCIEVADSLFRTSDVEAIVIAAVDLAGSLENLTLRLKYGPVSSGSSTAGAAFSAQGWTAGEGAGALVLQRASQAEPGRVYATVEGLAFAQGTTREAIETAALGALREAGKSPSDMTLVEASASGFAEEDHSEHEALGSLYPGIVPVSIKSQLGHSFSAAGMPAILASVVTLGRGGHRWAALSGLGRDLCSAHLVLQAPSIPRLAKTPTRPAKVGLIKTLVLGGAPVAEALATHVNDPLVISIRTKLSRLSPGRLPVHRLETAKEVDAPVKTSSITTVPRQIAGQYSAHRAFLEMRQAAQKQMAALIRLQAGIPAAQSLAPLAPATAHEVVPAPAPTPAAAAPLAPPPSPPLAPPLAPPRARRYRAQPISLVERFSRPRQVIFDTQALTEFAEGSIGKVFGSEYALIDSYPRRVRLPTTDYLLVTRVTDLDATRLEYRKSYMATEYDIPLDAPYLIDGQIPWSVSVESGQCDLLLISYIGIDFMAKGVRVYRLLDCQLTFLEDMAFGGETLRYEIHIDSYAKNGEQLLFFFHYDCYVGGRKVLIMRGGCAGFFTDGELDEGKGVILNDKDRAELANARKGQFTPLIPNQRSQYEFEDMMRLVAGDVAGCFGPAYDQGGRNPSLKFSSEKFLMIERVTSIDPRGGHWGLGLLEGQKRLEPEHWYFPCHFKDDQVMAGSLMSEGCGQLAMFYMLWLGMHSGTTNARFQPLHGECQTVRCRGQVTPQSNVLTYRMEVTAIGMEPHPFMKANIDIILNGRVVVDFKNLSVMIKEQDPDAPYAARLIDDEDTLPFRDPSRPLMRIETDRSAALIKGVAPIMHFEAPFMSGQNRVPNKAPFSPWHLFEFATGDISNCFGPAFDVYKNRIPPRTPCGDLQLVTQVVEVHGTPLDLKKPASCRAEYYVPADAWYFRKNSHEAWMPYSIIMEIALQPNGFISGYMGTTLTYPDRDLFFRNLDGTGNLRKRLDLRGKTIVNDSVLLSTSMAGGAIIQSFTFALSVEGEVFYDGKAVFGYFSGESLANQLGIDNGRTTAPWFIGQDIPAAELEVISLVDAKHPYFRAPPGKPHYRLAGGQLHFVDTVTIVEGGGKSGKGYILGERAIDAGDWFFRYHFHQDPVMPGSLGIEAIIEILQVYAMKNDLGAGFRNPRFIAPLSTVVWKYRGQITPTNKAMTVDVHITGISREGGRLTITGDANLSKDNLRIYEVKDIVLSIEEA